MRASCGWCRCVNEEREGKGRKGKCVKKGERNAIEFDGLCRFERSRECVTWHLLSGIEAGHAIGGLIAEFPLLGASPDLGVNKV